MNNKNNEKPTNIQQTALQWISIILLFQVATELGDSFVLKPGSSGNVIWPPTGIAIAAIMYSGYRVIPAIFLAALISSNWSGSHYEAVIINSLIITLEATTLVWLLRGFIGNSEPIRKVQYVLLYISITVLVVFFSTTFELGHRMLLNTTVHSNFVSSWTIFYLSNSAGALIVAPLLITWISPAERSVLNEKRIEATSLLLLLIACCLFIFGGFSSALNDNYTNDFLIFPFLIYIVYRFRTIGATTSVALVSLIAIWGTLHGHGPFIEQTKIESVIMLQSFILVISVTLLIFSAALQERVDSESTLKDSEELYRKFITHNTEGIYRISLQQPLSTNLPMDEQINLIFENGYFAEVNDRYLNTLGFSNAEQLLDKKFSDVYPSSDINNKNSIGKFIESEYKLRYFITNDLHPNRRQRFFSAHITGIVTADHLTHIWAIVTDITAENLLRQLHEKIRNSDSHQSIPE